jgi:hypothetical protein
MQWRPVRFVHRTDTTIPMRFLASLNWAGEPADDITIVVVIGSIRKVFPYSKSVPNCLRSPAESPLGFQAIAEPQWAAYKSVAGNPKLFPNAA